MDTIFAVSSGLPPAAIAIVRVSGARAAATASALIRGPLPPLRRAVLRVLYDPRNGTVLDRALVLFFPGPGSATGEDVVEFHVHGGRAVVAAVESALSRLPGLRRADPGEFTRRALLNGVIDLTEAEGLGDLLAAETEAQRRAAMQIAEGGLRAKIDGWTARLIEIAAYVEAQLDFSDEDDVATPPGFDVPDALRTIMRQIETLLAEPPVERLKDGIRIVLAGPPNSGKSTLLNAMADRDVAIVSPIAGTTRDRIEAAVIRDGIAYVLTDTAGLTDDSNDPIERIGVMRARSAIDEADIVVWLGDDASPVHDAIELHARSDIPGRAMAPSGKLIVSARTDFGLAALWNTIVDRSRVLLPAASVVPTNTRQRAHLTACRDRIERAADEVDLVLVAEELRLALKPLHALTGRADVEHVLDAVFNGFCIGK